MTLSLADKAGTSLLVLFVLSSLVWLGFDWAAGYPTIGPAVLLVMGFESRGIITRIVGWIESVF